MEAPHFAPIVTALKGGSRPFCCVELHLPGSPVEDQRIEAIAPSKTATHDGTPHEHG